MIEFSQLIAYTIALGIAAAIPGPGMTALVARSVANGAKSGFAMLSGLILGDLFYLSLAVFGLAVIAQNFGEVFIVIKILAALYLAFLAWKFWTAEHGVLQAKVVDNKELFSAAASGFAITLSNPKTIAFYLALLPVVIDVQAVSFSAWAYGLVPATIMILIVVGGSFVLGALAVRKFLVNPKAQKYLYRSAAGAMLVAAGSMLART